MTGLWLSGSIKSNARQLSCISRLKDQVTKYLTTKDLQITLNLHQNSKGPLLALGQEKKCLGSGHRAGRF